jgi:hypothetical protein
LATSSSIPPRVVRLRGAPITLSQKDFALVRALATDPTRVFTNDELELYRQRQPMIEPVFGQTEHNRGVARFHRRGRAAVRTEWRLITATHNLLTTTSSPPVAA